MVHCPGVASRDPPDLLLTFDAIPSLHLRHRSRRHSATRKLCRAVKDLENSMQAGTEVTFESGGVTIQIMKGPATKPPMIVTR